MSEYSMVARLMGDITSFEASMTRAQGIMVETGTKATAMGAQVEQAGLNFDRIGKYATAGFVVAGAAAVKMASDFESSVLRIQTQAGASTAEVAKMSDAVLKLGGQVGESPKKLAEALYYVESAGMRGAEGLNVLKLAAEGAQISGANLTDVTKALTSVITSGVPGITDAHDAMAQLNAVVGAGKLTMQDLSAAMQTGILGRAKEFGVSFESIGAALDVMTNHGHTANEAATALSTGLALMAAPTAKATSILTAMGVATGEVATITATSTAALAKAGVSTTQLAEDLRNPNGILVALQDMKGHMEALGISATDQLDVVTRAFGGASRGKAIGELFVSLDELKGRFAQIGQAAGSFDASFEARTHTMQFQFDAIKASIDAWAVSLGTALIPKIQATIGFVQQHAEAARILAEVIGGALVVAAGKWAAAQVDAFGAAAVTSISTVISRVQSLGTAVTGATSGLGSFAAGLGIVGGAAVLAGGLLYVFQQGAEKTNRAIAEGQAASTSAAQAFVADHQRSGDVAQATAAKIAELATQLKSAARAGGLFSSGNMAEVARLNGEILAYQGAAKQATDANGPLSQSLHETAAAAGMTDEEFRKLTDAQMQNVAATEKQIATYQQSVVSAFSKATDSVAYFSASQIASREKAATKAETASNSLVNADTRVADAEQRVADLTQQFSEQAATAKENYAAKVDASNQRVAETEQSLADTIATNNLRIADADRKLADDRISLAQSVADAQERLTGDRASGAQSIADAEQRLADIRDRQSVGNNPAARKALDDQIQIRDATNAVQKAKEAAAKREEADLDAIGKAQQNQIKTLAKDQENADKARTTQAREVEKAEDAVAKAKAEQNKLAAEGLTVGSETLAQQREMRNALESVTKAHESVGVAAEKAGTAEQGAIATTFEDVQKFYRQATDDGGKFSDDIRTAIEKGYDPVLMSRLLQEGPNQAAPFLALITSQNNDTLRNMVNEGEKTLRAQALQVSDIGRLVKKASDDDNGQIRADFDNAMKLLALLGTRGGKETAENLAKELGIGVDDVKRIAGEYGGALAAGINPVLAGIGANSIAYNKDKALTYDPSSYTYRATGGIIPGVGTGDTVPAMLTPGEFVVRKPAVDAIGVGMLHALNAKGYASGGFVSAADVPHPPDFSAYGNMLGYGAAKTDQYAYDKVIDYLAGKAASGSGPGASGPVPPGQVSDWVAAGVALAGKPSSWVPPEINIAMFESGGDPKAINNWDSNAAAGTPSKGLMQVIDPTFQAKMVAGHGDIWNPIDNVAAATNYIAGRYGDPWNTPGEKSLARGGSYQGYAEGGLVRAMSFDQGGWLPPGATLAFNGTGAPERVGGGTMTIQQVIINLPNVTDARAAAVAVRDELLRYQRNNGGTGIRT